MGLASKLDVFRAELQAAQARDAMVRSEAALATALERFRGAARAAPGRPRGARGRRRCRTPPTTSSRVEVLVQRALEARLELQEARDQVDDARRSASLARQNLLPQLDLNVGVTQLGFGGVVRRPPGARATARWTSS